MFLRLKASSSRRRSTNRRECTKTYTTKVARTATTKCEAYKQRSNLIAFNIRFDNLFRLRIKQIRSLVRHGERELFAHSGGVVRVNL